MSPTRNTIHFRVVKPLVHLFLDHANVPEQLKSSILIRVTQIADCVALLISNRSMRPLSNIISHFSTLLLF